MIPRYSPKDLALIWTPKAQFQSWLEVELAVIQARCNLKIYPANIISEIQTYIKPASFMTDEIVQAIIDMDRLIEHDLQAFVDVVRTWLPENLRHYIHDGLTSYDTEVPALALQFQIAIGIILADLQVLIDALQKQASHHMWTFCMGNTHGQDAKPTTFGWRLCGYLEMLQGAHAGLVITMLRIEEVKCSGAVGTYENISPRLEAEVCRLLGLQPRRAATQIVARDVLANLLSVIATTGGCLEKIATDIRLLASSPFGEVREPRKAEQKGSSAMPHKKNTIITERICGMAIMLRGYAVMGQELIRTWLERDISHSSTERVAFADATCILDYMLQKMSWIFEGLEVNRERKAQGISRSRGCWASEDAKLLLERKGLDPEYAYRLVQGCAFAAFEDKKDFEDVLQDQVGRERSIIISSAELDSCFDFANRLRNSLPTAYKRFNLDESLALPSNL